MKFEQKDSFTWIAPLNRNGEDNDEYMEVRRWFRANCSNMVSINVLAEARHHAEFFDHEIQYDGTYDVGAKFYLEIVMTEEADQVMFKLRWC